MIRKYFSPVIRWWWLIVLSTLAAGISSFVSVSRMPPVYEAHASLVVGSTIQDPNPTSGEFYLQQQLAAAYASIGGRQIAGPTMETLGLPALPEFSVRAVPNSSLIEVVVSDTNPERAQAVANELTNQLIKQSPSSKTPEEQQREEFVSQQLDNLQRRIQETEQEISATQLKLADTTNARQIADIQELIVALENKMTSLQTTYTDLLASTAQGSVNNLEVLQYSPLPGRPVGPNKPLYILLASLIGLSVSTAIAYLIELIDNRVKTGEEIGEMLDTPILGRIPAIAKKENLLTYTLRQPRSPATDAFRNLRTNLEFLGVSKPVKKILVSGAYASDGKSTVAANLASIFAQAQRKVILVETDMRRPNLHHAFGVSNEPGLSDVCVGRVSLEKAMISANRFEDASDPDLTVPMDSTTFRFLPAGMMPPNPAELLASNRFETLLAELEQQAEFIIIDSPPLFVPDAASLLNKVDGVLLVFQPANTRKNSLALIKDQIQRSGARLLGVVLNRAGGESMYYEYRYDQDGKTKTRIEKPRLPTIKGKLNPRWLPKPKSAK